jgi:hypothetical protein
MYSHLVARTALVKGYEYAGMDRYGRLNYKRTKEWMTAWAIEEYKNLMGQEPPDEGYEQFQYNPRTKAGKALLREVVASDG